MLHLWRYVVVIPFRNLERIPDAIIKYDRYHVMQHMGPVVDRSRRHGWNVLREDVDRVLKSHRDIEAIYGLKEPLGHLGYEKGYDVANHQSVLLITAEHSVISAVKDAIRGVDNRFKWIVNWFRPKMNFGVMKVATYHQGSVWTRNGYRIG